jgi:glycosyltransferase involved in cell wall biosynthesis
MTHLEWETWLLESGWWCADDIVHCHDGWAWAPAMWAVVMRGKRVAMTIHDQMTRRKWDQIRWFYRLAARRLFRSPRVWWIAVSSEVKRQLLDLGADAERIRVIPAYLAPPAADVAAAAPTCVLDFVRSHAPVLSTYGWRLCFDTQGRDLYGFDLCIELVRQLRANYPRVGMVACLPQIHLPDYYAELRRRIAGYGLEEHVLFVTEPLDEAYPLWQASDLYVRATSTDGDALAVREALSLGVPVVASDASPRPPGTVLFPSRDLDALVAAVRQVLGDKQRFVEALSRADSRDFFRDLLNLYETMLTS